MTLIGFLMGFPALAALVLLFAARTDGARGVTVRFSALVTALAAFATAVTYFNSGTVMFSVGSELFSSFILAMEVILGLIILYVSFKAGRILIGLLGISQTALIAWFELGPGHGVQISSDFTIDLFIIIMIMIVGVIGSLITVFALGYMKDFQQHAKDQPDNRPFFFFVMYIFLAAMFGLVTANNLLFMYFFWEVTSFCSFLLIGYTKTEEAVQNSFRALWMNLLGGLGMAVAICWLGIVQHTVELSQLIALGASGINVALPACLFVFGGLTKAAQMPFSSWLLGAMVAPTPTSALLHSSTMVKAGVFMIIRLSPILGENQPGVMAMFVGGITFLFASFAAISQSNGKRVLAYSTISNLGLIVCCAGIGTYEAAWTAIMLVVFHAVSKSLCFLTVGTAEHHVGSRNIEDFDGLFSKMPQLAVCMAIGICGMFLAPFGMLISKWAAMKAFIDSNHALLTLILVFGSSTTFFFWTKWLGKITAIVAGTKDIEDSVHGSEWVALKGLATLTIVVCILFPLISSYLVIPYLTGVYKHTEEIISQGNMMIMSSMVVLLVILPLLAFGHSNKKLVNTNMAGENVGDDLHFRSALKSPVEMSLRNWYMENWFGEKKVLASGCVLAVCAIIVEFSSLFGGVIHV